MGVEVVVRLERVNEGTEIDGGNVSCGRKDVIDLNVDKEASATAKNYMPWYSRVCRNGYGHRLQIKTCWSRGRKESDR